MEIEVRDEIPGKGKTVGMIREINHKYESGINDGRLLVITPYLSECHRISGVDYKLNKNKEPIPKIRKNKFIYVPYDCKYNCVPSQFKHPYATDKGGKSSSLLKLVIEEQNIVGTHSLYQLLSRNIYRQLKSREYTLILDETLSVAEKFNGGGYRPKRIQELWDRGYLWKEDDTGVVRWREDQEDVEPSDSVAPVIKRLVDNGNLVVQDTSDILLWTMPINFLCCFKKVIILTHNWEGSMMQKYITKYSDIIPNVLFSTTRDDDYKQAFSMLNVLDDDKMNAIGSETAYDLSHSDSDRLCKSGSILTLKNNLVNWFNNINQGQTKDDRAVTTFKSCEGFLRGNGYSKSFLPLNLRAVDHHKHRSTVAYCCNVFQDRNIKRFLDMSQKDEDRYSLNEMIQWIWRFSIRDNKELNLYLPSSRMRNLLLDFVKSKS